MDEEEARATTCSEVSSANGSDNEAARGGNFHYEYDEGNGLALRMEVTYANVLADGVINSDEEGLGITTQSKDGGTYEGSNSGHCRYSEGEDRCHQCGGHLLEFMQIMQWIPMRTLESLLSSRAVMVAMAMMKALRVVRIMKMMKALRVVRIMKMTKIIKTTKSQVGAE